MAELEPLTVRLGTLTGKQMKAIELSVGLPMGRWEERSSDVGLAAAVRSALEGRPVDEYLDEYPALTLINSVVIADGEDEDDPGNA